MLSPQRRRGDGISKKKTRRKTIENKQKKNVFFRFDEIIQLCYYYYFFVFPRTYNRYPPTGTDARGVDRRPVYGVRAARICHYYRSHSVSVRRLVGIRRWQYGFHRKCSTTAADYCCPVDTTITRSALLHVIYAHTCECRPFYLQCVRSRDI